MALKVYFDPQRFMFFLQATGFAGSCSEEVESVSSSAHGRDSYFPSAPSGSKELHLGEESKQVGQNPSKVSGDGETLTHEFPDKLSICCQQGESHLPSKCSDEHGPSPSKVSQSEGGHSVPENVEDSAVLEPFDICPPKTSNLVVLKPPLLVKNRERRNETKRIMEAQNASVLRSGMVLLKRYLPLNDQVLLYANFFPAHSIF